jgi:hypothetical protein
MNYEHSGSEYEHAKLVRTTQLQIKIFKIKEKKLQL